MSVNNIFIACSYGGTLGLNPFQSLQGIAMVNGKPSVYGDTLLGLVRPLCEDFQEWFDDQTGTAFCVIRRRGSQHPVQQKFSYQDAQRAGLTSKKGPWTQYPERMLQMRARGFAIRDAFPDVLSGVITREEAEDYPQRTAEMPQIPQQNVSIPQQNVAVQQVTMQQPVTVQQPMNFQTNQEQIINGNS
jgi:hypothetical protein